MSSIARGRQRKGGKVSLSRSSAASVDSSIEEIDVPIHESTSSLMYGAATRSRNLKVMKRPPPKLSADAKLELRQACRKAALKAEARSRSHRVLDLDMVVANRGEQPKTRMPPEQDPRDRSRSSLEDDHSASSFLSHERAIQRGLQRGEYEYNERSNEEDLDSIDELLSIDYELTTVSDSNISRTDKRKRHTPLVWRGWRTVRGGKSKSSKSKQGVRQHTSSQGSSSSKRSLIQFKKSKKQQSRLRSAKEAWMCGVCAKSFPTMEAAERHEDYHIKEVVLDLGWTNETSVSAEADGGSSPVPVGNGSSNGVFTPSSGFSSAPAGFFEAPAPPRTLSSDNDKGTTPFVTPATKAVQPRPDRIISSRKPPPPKYRVKRPIRSSSDEQNQDHIPRVSFHRDLIASPAPLRMKEKSRNLTDSASDPGAPRTMVSIAEDRTVSFDNQRSSALLNKGKVRAPDIGDLDRDIILDYVVLADEALVDVCRKAEPLILTASEVEAHTKLKFLAKDKKHYDLLAQRTLDRRRDGDYARFRAEGKTLMSKVQNKFVDAYQLIKQGGDDDTKQPHDHYASKNKRPQKKSDENTGDIHGTLSHTDGTIYINVVVKNSIQLVRHELERLAKQRWEDSHNDEEEKANEDSNSDHGSVASADRRLNTRKRHARQQELFQRFRAAAQGHLVNLAGIALASDFTPRRIAVQLSNDLYRQLTPRLKRRGVTVATEIEYRIGPYFVLAVNVKHIDWARVNKVAYRGVIARRKKSRLEAEANGENNKSVALAFFQRLLRLSRMTSHEILAQFLAWMHFCHWIVYLPICAFLYRFCCGSALRTYFLASVADDIFSYVEEKGMEMDIGVRTASEQAGTMLSSLREIRDGRSQKTKTDDSKSAKTGKPLVGPLLGPIISADKGPAPSPPEGFEVPQNLEFVALDIDLPVGFCRLRRGLLSTQSTFLSEAIFRVESNYDNIEMGTWSVHDEHIAAASSLPDGITESDFIGAEKTNSYLMPKSAFVKANTCTETMTIEAYNDYCVSIRKKALTPEVPYGSTFVAWTKIILINTGSNTCKMIGSVEAEFPNGEPMISRQIRGGMRQGVTEAFVTMGETITKYADEYP